MLRNKLPRGPKRLLLAEARSLLNLRRIAREQFEYNEDIRDATERAASQFEQALLVARMDAREQSRLEAEDELDEDVEIEAFTEEDRTRSHLLGRSTAAGIGMMALILVGQKQPKPGLLAIAHADYKLRRLAATEAANAYSRAHYDVRVDASAWLIQWDATLDLKLCKLCKGMHGKTVAIGESFEDDLVPGDVHPHCRCIPVYLSISKAA